MSAWLDKGYDYGRNDFPFGSLNPPKPFLIENALAEKRRSVKKFPSRVFVNYRRDDTLPYAERLHQTLAGQFGAESIFRDVTSIQPGENFRAAIERAVISSEVMLVLIGRKWLRIASNGRRRLDAKDDYVRVEIETALVNGVEIIPLLVDGAKMPATKQLPKSIAALTGLNAYRLSWHEEMVKLESRIKTISKRHAELEAARQVRSAQIDLARRSRFSNSTRFGNLITDLMELSLRRNGFRVRLDLQDLDKQTFITTGRRLKEGVILPEMIYVIDHVGIGARGDRPGRYCARSISLSSIKEIPEQLRLNHPILAGVTVQDFWFSESVSRKGIIDIQKLPGTVQGGVFVGIVGHDPSTSMFRFESPWPTWGQRGFGWITERAAAAYLNKELRAINAAPMVDLPFHIAERRQREANRRVRKRRK